MTLPSAPMDWVPTEFPAGEPYTSAVAIVCTRSPTASWLTTVMEMLAVVVFEFASRATACKVCGPSLIVVEFHVVANNGPDPAIGLPIATPSTWNARLDIPALDDADAANWIVPPRLTPAAGELKVTAGPYKVTARVRQGKSTADTNARIRMDLMGGQFVVRRNQFSCRAPFLRTIPIAIARPTVRDRTIWGLCL